MILEILKDFFFFAIPYNKSMNIQIRYLSKLGHTKAIAEAIARGANAKALSITEEPELKEHVDLLFLGGAPYANIMDKALSQYVKALTKEMVDEVVLFTTSNWSRRTVNSIRKTLTKKGIAVRKDYFYAHMLRIEKRVPAAEEFGAKHVKESQK